MKTCSYPNQMNFSLKRRMFSILVLLGCHVSTPLAAPPTKRTEIPFELSRNHIFTRADGKRHRPLFVHARYLKNRKIEKTRTLCESPAAA